MDSNGTISIGIKDVTLLSKISVDRQVKDFQLYLYLNEVEDINEFQKRIRRLLRPARVTDFAHTSLLSVAGILDPFGTYSTYVTDLYAREGFHSDDITVRALLREKRPIFRSVVDQYVASAPFDTEIFANHREAQQFMQRHGLNDVYNVPILSETKEVLALFSISAHRRSPADFIQNVTPHADNIRMIGYAVDGIGSRRFKNHFHKDINPRVPIPYAPLRLIETLAQKGCTLNEAAEVLGISISTANQQIAVAKKALGVHTTGSAILNAYRQKLILVE